MSSTPLSDVLSEAQPSRFRRPKVENGRLMDVVASPDNCIGTALQCCTLEYVYRPMEVRL